MQIFILLTGSGTEAFHGSTILKMNIDAKDKQHSKMDNNAITKYMKYLVGAQY